MDTRLRHGRPRLELSRGIVAECGVTAQPIVEHLDVLEDVLFRVFARAVLLMVDQLALERAEETFDVGVVPAVPSARHAHHDAVGGGQLLVRRGGILDAPIRVVHKTGLGSAMYVDSMFK